MDVVARIVEGSDAERVVSLKGIDLPGAPLKLTTDSGCEFDMRLAPSGSEAVEISMEIRCEGAAPAHPRITTGYDEPARVVIDDGKRKRLSLNVTVNKTLGKRL